jgi:hypothetical protein
MGFVEQRLNIQEAQLGFEETGGRDVHAQTQLFSIIYIMRHTDVSAI